MEDKEPEREVAVYHLKAMSTTVDTACPFKTQ